MPQRAIADALALWRYAERLLEELPAEAPERKVISFELGQIRATYRRLTESSDITPDLIARSITSLEKSRLMLLKIRDRRGLI